MSPIIDDTQPVPVPAMLSVRVSDAMRLTGIGKTKMFELIADGTLKTTLIGRRRLILYASLQELILKPRG
ncbi:DNA-binding protein [Sphingomonas paucimobilis]|uniref:DNA-binding protein n=1 Tax=Sphingomonas paucimobilis TaxID=13689 RepID=UPI000DE40825|nr:DNA-binding protein [Sphingomonas paucimobilis]QBE92453.1 DNA-binding protein [Sphingomonas paucimobilis]